MDMGHHSGMDMGSDSGMDMGGAACKISMTWNWFTIDACFISDDWQITSSGMMAGSCIGVVVLVIALEFIRRFSKEYDRFLLRQHVKGQQARTGSMDSPSDPQPSLADQDADKNKTNASVSATGTPPHAMQTKFRPSIVQQVIRAFLHMVQFAVAYFVMLLAMYFNGYIIISILVGAFIGGFVFTWEWIELGPKNEELTMCCG